MVIVKVFIVGVVLTSKVFVVKLAAVYPVVGLPGVVALVKINSSPTNNPCEFLLIVTVADPVTEVYVQEVNALVASSGVIS
jgi:hypothetical protein